MDQCVKCPSYLKPCPFCGSNMIRECRTGYSDYYIICKRCGCRTSTFPGYFENKMIQKWNNRKRGIK